MKEKEFIGKRVNLDVKNIRKMKIIATFLEIETKWLNERKKA